MCTKEGTSEFFRVGWLGNCLLKLLHCFWQKELIDSPILTQIFSLKKDNKKKTKTTKDWLSLKKKYKISNANLTFD